MFHLLIFINAVHFKSTLWRKQLPLDCQTRLYTVSIYTATMDQPEFKYRCWVWIFFFIWNAWIIERERRWGGIHSGDGWSRHRFPTYTCGYWMGRWRICPLKWFASDFSRLLKDLMLNARLLIFVQILIKIFLSAFVSLVKIPQSSLWQDGGGEEKCGCAAKLQVDTMKGGGTTATANVCSFVCECVKEWDFQAIMLREMWKTQSSPVSMETPSRRQRQRKSTFGISMWIIPHCLTLKSWTADINTSWLRYLFICLY